MEIFSFRFIVLRIVAASYVVSQKHSMYTSYKHTMFIEIEEQGALKCVCIMRLSSPRILSY